VTINFIYQERERNYGEKLLGDNFKRVILAWSFLIQISEFQLIPTAIHDDHDQVQQVQAKMKYLAR
jgi:hypothetical protein